MMWELMDAQSHPLRDVATTDKIEDHGLDVDADGAHTDRLYQGSLAIRTTPMARYPWTEA